MKKQLLFGVALLAALMPNFANAEEGETSSNLKLVWKNTNLDAVGNSRVYQGHVYDDKYYIMNGADNKVIIMDKDGKVGEIDAPLCWMNFGKDEAGNFIMRRSDAFNGGFYDNNEMMWTMVLLDPRTNELTECETKPGGYQNTYGGNNFTFGTAAGDVFGEDEEAAATATMAVAFQYGGTDPIKFWGGDVAIEGAHCGEWDWQYIAGATGEFSELIDPVELRGAPKVATTTVLSTYSFYKKYDEDGNEAYLPEAAVLNPYYDLTGESNGTGNSITHLINNGRDEFTAGGFYVTPGHNGMQGFELFECGGERYIVYTSGDELSDGFSVARIDKDYNEYLRSTPESKPDDYDYLVAYKNADVDEFGFTKWASPGETIWCYINTFDIVPSDQEGHVFIYQYVPCAYIAKYDLDLSNGSVASAVSDNDATKVYGAEGKITVIGGEVEVYTIDGKLVARTSESILCAAGLYIVKTATKSVKVIVK